MRGEFDIVDRKSNRSDPAGGIAKALQVVDAETVGHAQKEIGAGLAVETHIATRCEGTAAAAGENDGKIEVRVPVAICMSATVNDHGVMEQRITICVLGLLHSFKEAGKVLHVVVVDFADAFNGLLAAAVMREIVVPLRDANLRKGTVGAIAC